jgi:hypothetical protein
MASNKERSPRKPTLLSVAKQAKKAGIEVARYEIEPSGKIVVVTGKGDSVSVEANNPWDTVLGNGRRDGPSCSPSSCEENSGPDPERNADHAPKQKRTS